MMKRNLFGSLLALALLLFPALAQGEDCALVRLNDGAPIPFLEDHESATFGAWIRGVTGAIPLDSVYLDRLPEGVASIGEYEPWTLTLQNLAVTKDHIVLFSKVEADEPFPFSEAKNTYFINQIAPKMIFMEENGAWRTDPNTARCEVRLLDERTALCATLQSLTQPLDAGERIELGILRMGRCHVSLTVDDSAAVMPGTRLEVNETARFTEISEPGGAPQTHDVLIKSVAFSPLGGHVVLEEEDKGVGHPPLGAICLRDGAGRVHRCHIDFYSRDERASEEHPVRQRTIYRFEGGEASGELSLMPLEITQEGQAIETAVDLADLPAAVPVGESTLHVQSFSLSPGGYEIRYYVEGDDAPPYIDFYPADAAHAELTLYEVLYKTADLTAGYEVAGGYWCDEYKGRRVCRASDADAAKIKSLIVRGRLPYSYRPLEDQAVVIAH